MAEPGEELLEQEPGWGYVQDGGLGGARGASLPELPMPEKPHSQGTCSFRMPCLEIVFCFYQTKIRTPGEDSFCLFWFLPNCTQNNITFFLMLL